MRNPLDLTGRRVLVTGASVDSDIGRELCRTLADLGAALTLVGRRADALEATRALLAEPERHCVAPFDLTDLDAIPGWMKRLAEADGPFHGLVHSASEQGYSVLRQVNRAQFERYFTLNVGAALMLARGFHQKGVFAPGGGAIVYVGSVAGLKGQKGRSLYAASKAALVSVAQSLALELADRKIRVNVVAPAVVLGAKAEKQFAMLPAEQNAALAAAHPLGYGIPQDVADAVAYLLADSGRWITGTALPVDGGFTAQ
ncbi:SDR family NAD(P)-dependent oxidoreductase [Azospirillum canadense]|uniref:SDR family NAD(P)-dependent oxidoreductase n=1 Tax=Azospirillum canadense TaxID=403962 RepID=UPI002227E645|nr:SDR family oxidoreductase [Azospirillum canadense]MCW2243742.1 NAD(P)-dependent dehydrogenase (short-subunit alcohol dehydrogenase family) [Azospirillum canadense]